LPSGYNVDDELDEMAELDHEKTAKTRGGPGSLHSDATRALR
jgi:hypothetical protein